MPNERNLKRGAISLCDNTTTKTKIQVTKKCKIEPWEEVKVTQQGNNYAELLYMKNEPEQGVKKISKTQYQVLKTGEIKEYEQRDGKYEESLAKTFKRLRALIRTNFTSGGDNQLFITLTYGENMIDTKRLMTDFDSFKKRLKRAYKKHKFDYIAVVEPQDRGAWHMHVLLKTDQPVLYIDNKELEKIWGHGWTEAVRLRSDDCGSYYVAYFTDVLADEEQPHEEDERTEESEKREEDKEKKENKSKRRLKGERLKLYPKGFKFYRTSRGIKEPIIEKCTYQEALDKHGKPCYENTFEIVAENTKTGASKVVNQIYKATFKKNGENGRKSKKK